MPDAENRFRLGRQRRLFLIAATAALAAFVVVAVLMRNGVLDGIDERFVNWFAGHQRRPLTGIAEILDALDTWWILILLIAAVVGGLWWSGRMVQAVYAGLTIVVAIALNPIVKLAFARQPPDADPAIQTAVYSFPSGHTTTATATATALAVVFWPTRWRWPVTVLAVLFAFGMAVSRVYLGVHWPTDVAGGLALGFAIAMAVRAVVPWPTPEEAAAALEAEADPARGDRARARGRRRPRRAPAAAQDALAGPQGTRAGDAPGIDVVFLDWGNTLMVDPGLREGPMKDWATVEAEPGAQRALLRLSARYRLVVATNAEDSREADVRIALARVGLEEHVDDVISSADVGDHKPNYGFFRAALLREGDRGLPLDPRRAVMVGDATTNDIKGAQRAGMRTIWYNPTKRRFPEGQPPPDAVIKKLTDLPAVVDKLAGVKPEKRSRRQRKADADAIATAAALAAARELRTAVLREDASASAAAAVPDGGRASTTAAAAPCEPATSPPEASSPGEPHTGT